MNLKLTTIVALLFCFFSFDILAQFQHLSDAELERMTIANKKNGKVGHEGIYTNLVFEVNDFSRLNKSFESIKLSLTKQFNIENINLLLQEQKFEVVFHKPLSTTDDFLKILKEVLMENEVYLKSYEEFKLSKVNGN